MKWEEFLGKVRRGEVILTKAPALSFFNIAEDNAEDERLPKVVVRWSKATTPYLVVVSGKKEEVVSDIPPGLELLLAKEHSANYCQFLSSRIISYINRAAHGKIFYMPLKQINIQKVFDDWYSGELQCPYCGFEFNHIIRVDVIQCPMAVSVERNAVKAFPGFQVAGRRGSTVALSFECENQHIWTLFLTFHKGIVYAAVEVMEEYDDEEELWRD